MTIRIGSVVMVGDNMYIVVNTYRVSRTVDGQKMLDLVDATSDNCSACFPYKLFGNGEMMITTYSDGESVTRKVIFVAATVKQYILSRLRKPFPELG